MIEVRKLLPMPVIVSLYERYNKTNIFFGLIEYELKSLLGPSHLVDYCISVHIRFDLERHLLIIWLPKDNTFLAISLVLYS